jgi:hypothetical protein
VSIIIPARATRVRLGDVARWAAILLCMCVTGSPAAANCAGDGPQVVLTCLTDAYSHRDIDAYRNLISRDFVFQYGEDGPSWGYDDEMQSATVMLTSPKTKAVRMEIPDGYRVFRGSGVAPWIITDVTVLLAVDAEVDGATQHYEVKAEGVRLWVEEVSEPVPHYQIVRWFSPAESSGGAE